MRRALPPVLLLAAVVSLASSAAMLDAQGGRDFSADERRRLIDGELVRRPRARNQGGFHYIGGTSWMRVDAPQDEVWETVQDTAVYPRLIPGVEEVRLEREQGDERLLYLRHRYLVVTAGYYATARTDAENHTIRFELDRSRPHDVRAGHGFITVDAYRGDESIVTWGVMADVGSQILTGMFSSVIYDWILKVPWCVRGQVEPGRPHC